MSSVDVLGSLDRPLEPAGPDKDVVNVELVDVVGQFLAVLLPGLGEVAVPAQPVEAVVVALAVSGEVESPGHHADVDEIVHDPDDTLIEKVSINVYFLIFIKDLRLND